MIKNLTLFSVGFDGKYGIEVVDKDNKTTDIKPISEKEILRFAEEIKIYVNRCKKTHKKGSKDDK